MALKPVNRVKLSAQIEQQLKEQIIEGRWQSGEKLPSENELARIFGVSRVSVRQALQALAAQGLIETRVGDGSFVAQPDLSDLVRQKLPMVYLSDDSVHEVLELRTLLEPPVAELAVSRATDKQIAELAELMSEMERHPDDTALFSSLDYDFHMLISKMVSNTFIEGIYALQTDVLRSSMRRILQVNRSENALHYHPLILEAFQKRDAKAARAIMEEHLRTTFEIFLRDKHLITRGTAAEAEVTA